MRVIDAVFRAAAARHLGGPLSRCGSRVGRVNSPAGPIVVVAHATALVAADFGEPEDRLWQLLRGRFGAIEPVERADDPLGAVTALRAYLAGRLDALDRAAGRRRRHAVPARGLGGAAHHPRRASPGATSGWPSGSAGRRRSGRSASPTAPTRSASSCPCHRVIGADGTLTGYGGGLPRKRWLLEHEGVLLRDRRLDPRRTSMPRLYDYLSSGNGYKCRLLLHQLGIGYERVELDILKGETRTPEFLARNPNGRIPALELDDGTVLAESNAILFYLADGTPFVPHGRVPRAQVLQWLFFEQYSHEPFIAVARFIHHFLPAGQPAPGRAAAAGAGRPRGAGRDGAAAGRPPVPGRRPLHDRRHRPLRLHPRRGRGRLRSRRLSGRARLARPGGGPARPRRRSPPADHGRGRPLRVTSRRAGAVRRGQPSGYRPSSRSGASRQ